MDSTRQIYEKAHEITALMIQSDETVAESYSYHAISTERLADVLYYSGKAEESYRFYREALSMHRKALELSPNDVSLLIPLTVSLTYSGWVAREEGEAEEAFNFYNEAVSILRRLHLNDPLNTFIAAKFIGSLGELGNHHLLQGNLDEALSTYMEADEFSLRFLERQVQAPSVLRAYAINAGLLSDVLIRSNYIEKAGGYLERARGMFEQLAAKDPHNSEYQERIAELLIREGDILITHVNRLEDAILLYEEANRLQKQVAERSGLSENWQIFAFTNYKLALGYEALERFDNALSLLHQARELLLDLRARGLLDDGAVGYRIYLPQIEEKLNTMK